MLALCASCSNGGTDRATPAPATTVAETTTSSAPSPSTTTTVPATTTSTARPATTASVSREGRAQALYAAWSRGDRAAAGRVAEPQAVAALFARPWQATDGWTFAECTGAAGSMICAWQRASGEQLLLRVESPAGGTITVSEVRFQPPPSAR